jgi:hypothetical protein
MQLWCGPSAAKVTASSTQFVLVAVFLLDGNCALACEIPHKHASSMQNPAWSMHPVCEIPRQTCIEHAKSRVEYAKSRVEHAKSRASHARCLPHPSPVKRSLAGFCRTRGSAVIPKKRYFLTAKSRAGFYVLYARKLPAHVVIESHESPLVGFTSGYTRA